MNDAKVQIPSRHDAKVFLATIGDASDQRKCNDSFMSPLGNLTLWKNAWISLRKGFLSRDMGGQAVRRVKKWWQFFGSFFGAKDIARAGFGLSSHMAKTN